MFYFVYAQKVGGYREHKFVNAEDMAEHVRHNHPGLFRGVPENDVEYDDKISELRRKGWRIPEEKKGNKC